MIEHKRVWWRTLIALASAGLLSGCYYYPYGYYPWGYPYPYAWGYPYPYMPPAPPPGPSAPSNPAAETLPPLNGPVERTPLPPAP